MGAGGVWKILAVAAFVTGCGASPAMRRGAPLARPRTEVQVASEGTRLYVVGGYPKDADARLDIYDAATGTWTSGATLPVGRNHLAVAAGGGSVYVFGGCCQPDGTSNYATAYRYDIASNRWSELPALPAACAAAAAAYLAGKVHLVGGSCVDGASEHDVARHLVFDPTAGTYTDAAPIPWPREHHALLVAHDTLYALGGRQETKTNETASMYAYDAAGDHWIELPAMPAPRSGFPAAVANDKIFVFGGDNGDETHQLPSHRDVFVYDLAAKHWDRRADLPYGVHGTGAATLRGLIYIPAGSPLGGHAEPLASMLVVTP